MGMGPDLSWMFDFAGTVLPIFFIVMLGIAAITAGKGLLRWSRNNSSPVKSVSARIVSKRSELRQQSQDESGASRASTAYYLTYELEGGLRMEFKVEGSEYGMSAEGDNGVLNYQGTRYHGFERHIRYSTAE
ncbi:DUF2500 domain-containing protein [Paenibacillus donghaensis]|uniref:DUF2500 domain-containing protein n=1 Tax=Paenibacillus donghaensis TaxID=414771 RepID=A0A2Z2KHT7_9BACL|nr:hypothetical protein B9T62_13865 [Paenibacillus donghaensis]